jgi:menaquinone-9 beta-reductase
MNNSTSYDVAIIGGGLAGLSASIIFAQQGYSVILFEKENYPYHKVCGEYISMESWDHLCSLGLDLPAMGLPRINELVITSPNGKAFQTKLPLGGFGMSRHLLDHQLSQIAKANGVKVLEQTKVDAVDFDANFYLTTTGSTGQSHFNSRICLGSYGKRSNLDIKWKRGFLDAQDKRLENFFAVKYHVKTDWPEHTIGLHNFKNGYCGISKIEKGSYCVCYISDASNLRYSSGNIKLMEEKILFENPHLKKIFSEFEVEEGFPLTISQISFSNKSQVEKHLLMTGDAGGMITPLCGNGMSIALHTGKIAAEMGKEFLQGKMSREVMERHYQERWEKNFSLRLQAGRQLQKFFGSTRLSNGFVQLFRTFPFMATPVIRLTHGKPF